MPKFMQINQDAVYYDDYAESFEFLARFVELDKHSDETKEAFKTLFFHAWKTDGQFRWNNNLINIIRY